MSMLERLRTTEITPRKAAYAVAAMVVVLAGLVYAVSRMAAAPPGREELTPASQRAGGVRVTVDEKKAGAAAPEVRPQVGDPYAVIAQRNLFQAVNVGSSAASGGNQSRGASGATRPTPAPSPVLPPMPVAPMGNIDETRKNVAFTGSVRIGGVEQALIENLQTKEWRYVSQGQSAFGYRVMTVSPQLIVLEKNGLQFALSIGENKTDAPPAAAKPGGDQKPEGGGPKPQPSG